DSHSRPGGDPEDPLQKGHGFLGGVPQLLPAEAHDPRGVDVGPDVVQGHPRRVGPAAPAPVARGMGPVGRFLVENVLPAPGVVEEDVMVADPVAGAALEAADPPAPPDDLPPEAPGSEDGV